MKFKSIKETIDWLVQNGNKEKVSEYYIAVNIMDSTVELSSKPIRKAKNKIIWQLAERRKEQKWNSVISEAFGGYICKSTVILVLGKQTANNVAVDLYVNNPYYKCSEPMHLYLRDKIDLIKQRQIENR